VVRRHKTVRETRKRFGATKNMNPEKYSPTSEDIQNAEEMLAPEQHLVSDVREKILTGNLELPKQATEQQQVEVLLIQRKSELDQSVQFLFTESKPTQEEFRAFAYRVFNLPHYLERELRFAMSYMPRWEVRTSEGS
jgi:hypothetical protein